MEVMERRSKYHGSGEQGWRRMAEPLRQECQIEIGHGHCSKVLVPIIERRCRGMTCTRLLLAASTRLARCCRFRFGYHSTELALGLRQDTLRSEEEGAGRARAAEGGGGSEQLTCFDITATSL